MSSHPLHGTKPLAEKLSQKCDWGEGSRHLYVFKLERPVQNRFMCREVYPNARFTGRAIRDDRNKLQPGPEAKSWGRAFPGWTVVFA